jgi:hypothetical protein
MKYKIGTAYNGLASGGKFNYTVFDSTTTITSGTRTIDAFGEVLIPIGSVSDSNRHREITAAIFRGESSKKILLPVYTGKSLHIDTTMNSEPSLPPVVVNIEPDSLTYHQRSKVTLRIHVRDRSGAPLPGVFSIAVAASNRMGLDRTRSIVQYERMPECWPALSVGSRSLKKFAGETPDYGYVLQDNVPVKRPVTLALMGNNFASFQTDSSGRFALPYTAMVTPVGGINYLSVADKVSDSYKIILCSRADSIDQQLATIHYPVDAALTAILPESEEVVPQSSPGMLATALVKAKEMEGINPFTGEYNSIHCDQDYVCTHHHGAPGFPDLLNCPYLEFMGAGAVTKPKEGSRYGYVPKKGAYAKYGAIAFVTYHCVAPPIPPFMKALDPILQSKPFPSPNIDGCNNLGSGLQSTVYWNHSLVTDKNGDITVSFFTDDLTGKFSCDLQGVSAAGVIASRSYITVAERNTPAVNTTAQNISASNSNSGGH